MSNNLSFFTLLCVDFLFLHHLINGKNLEEKSMIVKVFGKLISLLNSNYEPSEYEKHPESSLISADTTFFEREKKQTLLVLNKEKNIQNKIGKLSEWARITQLLGTILIIIHLIIIYRIGGCTIFR